jgi:hypothetical protein
MKSKLCQDRQLFEYNDREFSARFIYSHGGYRVDCLERKVFIPLQFVVGLAVGFVAIVVATSVGPDIAGIFEDAVGVVVLGGGGGEVELDQQIGDGYSAYDEREQCLEIAVTC